MRYEIIGRIMDGQSVLGYVLEDYKDNKRIKLSRKDTELLAFSKLIINCYAQKYKESVILKGKELPLRCLPKYNKHGERDKKGDEQNSYKIIAKRKSGRETTEYIIESSDGKVSSINRNNTIKLAELKRITNVRVQEYKGRKILRGCNGTDLEKLDIVE